MMLLTGCWDNVPIEERGFVVGSSLDKEEKKVNDNDELLLTNQFVIPPGIGSNASGESPQASAFVNLTAKGDSVFAMDADMASLTSKMPFFEHLQLLVISEELISTPKLFENTLDIFVRDKQMRRGINVIVAERAKDILEIQPKNEKLPAVYINDLLEDSLKKTSLFQPIHIGDIHEYLLTNSSFTIPKFTPLEHEAKYEGTAVYHGFENKVVGSLNKDEVMALNFITSIDMHGGTLEFTFREHLITFQIYNTKSKVKLGVKDPKKIKIHVDIGVEGGIAEVFGNISLNNSENAKKIEEAAAKELEKLVHKTVEKAQQELNADIFGFDDKLRKRHYHTWQKIKNDWDHGANYFANSDIQITAKVKIRTTGATDKVNLDKKE